MKKRYVVISVIVILLICLGLGWFNRFQVFRMYANLYPKDNNVRVISFINHKFYYVDLLDAEKGYDVFEKYMESKGWKNLKDLQMGAIFTYEKDGVKKHVVNSKSNGYFLIYEIDE